MDDVETGENEAFGEEGENEYPDFISQLTNLATSAARQAYCCSSVLIFPVFSPLIDLTWTHWLENFASDLDVHSVAAIHYITVLVISTSGLIIGAILLHFIGRKLTVIAANLFELIFFLNAYLTGDPDTPVSPSSVTMVHHLVTGVGFVTFFIYLSEITSPTFRAFFMGFYWLVVIICNAQFKSIIWVKRFSDLFRNCSIVAAISLLLSLFILETPFWLTLNGNAEKAEETFMWLRAGDSDMIEFDKMLNTANNIMENSFQTLVFTSTFVVCSVFSFFLILGTFDPCALMTAFLYDHLLPQHKWLTYEEYIECRTVLFESTKNEFAHQVYGQLIFLLFNFLVPRKVLYFVSYIFSFLSVLPWGLKIKSVPILTLFASFCNVTPYIGILSLNQILPVEVYPIASREIGVAFGGSLEQLRICLDKIYLTSPIKFFSSLAFHIQNRSYMYISLYISVIGIPFVLIFMPETKATNIYELEELKLELPSIFRGSAEESDGTVAGEESSAGPDAYD